MELITLPGKPALQTGLFYFCLLNILFFPPLWGDRTLMASASDTPSILPAGAYSSTTPRTFFRMRDRAAAWQFEPGLKVTHEIMYEEHQLPWWNPYQGFGTPWAAAMIPQPFFPLTALAAIDPSARVVSWFVIIRLLIAGLLAYGFLRLFLDPMPSALGGLAFMLTGYFVINLNLDNLSTDILTPLALLGFEAVFRSGSARSLLLGVTSIWLVLISGMPESAVAILGFASLYFVFRILTSSANRAQAFRLLTRMAICAALAFLLSAFLLVPLLELMQNGVDAHRGAAMGLASVKLSRDILLYLLPLAAGPIYSSRFFSTGAVMYGYLGVGCAVLALSAIFSTLRKVGRDQAKLTVFFSLTLAFSLAKYFGWPPLQWIGTLPILRLMNFPQYMQPVIAFCVAGLCAYATDNLLKKRVRLEMLFAVLAVSAVAALCIVQFGWRPAGDQHEVFSYSLAVGGLIAGALLVIALLAAWRPPSRRVTFAALIVLIAFDLSFNYIYPIYYHFQELPSLRADPYRGAPYLDFLRNRKVGFDRVFGRQELYPSWASAFQIFDSRILYALYPGKLFPFARTFFNVGQTNRSGELGDRFTGEELPYSFSTPQEQRYLELSSTRFILTPSVLAVPALKTLIEETIQQNATDAKQKAPYFNETQFTIDGDTRPVLFEHPPISRIALVVQVPTGSPILRFSPAMHPGLFGSTCGDGVHFLLEEVEPDGRIAQLYSRYIDPKHNAWERHWLDESVDLSRFAGRSVKLLFSTDGGPAGNIACDWAGWATLSFNQPSKTPDKDIPNLKLVYDGEAKIYEYAHPLPRAALYQRVKVVNNEQDALRIVADPNEDVTREAVIVNAPLPSSEKELLSRLEKAPPQQVKAARITNFTSENVAIHTDLESEGVMMFTDTFYPGWQVYVDNQKRSLLQAGYMFRGVLLEKGSHNVDFRYEPSSVKWGGSITLAAFFGTILMIFKKRQRSD